MKFLALLLVVAAVHARSSLHHYGWAPETETVFKYQSQILTGIPEINQSQKSGLSFNCKVRVQSFQDYTLRVKLQEPRFITLNGEVSLNKEGRIIAEGGSKSGQEEHLPEEFRRFLEQPFLVHMKKGVVEEFFVAREEPVSVTNIKKAVLAQIQLDVSATQRSQIESNHIQLPIPSEETSNEELSFFTTEEESVHGQCRTAYTIHKLPEYKAKEMEEKWTTEEKILKHGVHSGLQSRSVSSLSESEYELESLKGKASCEGKTYYQITKTKDFDHCKVAPIWHNSVGVETSCDMATASCSDLLTHLSSSTYIVCGSLSRFHIRKVITEDTVVSKPLGFNTEEALKTSTLINTELIKVERMSTPFHLPTETKKESSLVYKYPTSQQPSEESIKESQEILGVVPVLPLPGLTEAPNSIIPIKREKSTIISEIIRSLKKMAREIFESPESCSSKSDIAGTMSITSQFMRSLSLSELKEVERAIKQEDASENNESRISPLRKLFYNTLSVVGTNPSTMLVIEKVKESELPLYYRTKMIQMALRSVRYPTKELLGELVKLAKSSEIERQPQLFSATVTGLSTLMYKAWIEPSTMLNSYPTKIYGVFGTKDAAVLKDEFIPFLGQKLESTDNQQNRLVIVTSLGKIGHIKAMEYLVKVAEGKIAEEEPLIRSLAVYSMKRVAKRNPVEVRPILLALINNPVEIPEVRIAAVAVLPWTRPTSADLQKLAVRTWTETSKEVASFITSTLKSLSYTEVPELKSVGSRCRTIISMLKPEAQGFEYSQGLHSAQFVDYLKTAVSQKLSYAVSKNSIVPSKVSMKTEYYMNSSYKVKGVSFAAYTQGMDTVLYKYLEILSPYMISASPKVKESLDKIFEELKVETSKLQTPKVFLQEQFMGIEFSSLIDSRIVLEAIEQVSQQVRGGQLTYRFSDIYSVQLIDATVFAMSDAGFPTFSELTMPVVVAAKGSFEVETSISESEGLTGRNLIRAKVIPIFNAKLQVNTGVVSPFTAQVLGSGVEASIHSSIPIECEMRLNRGELDLSIKTPSEVEQNARETETLHMFVHPYIIKRSLQQIKKETKTTIKSVAPMKHFEAMIGEHLGLNTRLIAETDAKFYDVYSYIEKIRQTSPVSFFSVVAFPSSVRMSSTKVKYNPALSNTKEFHIKVKLSTKTPEGRPISKFTSELKEESLSSKGFKSGQETLQQLSNGYSSVIEISTALKSKYGNKKPVFSSAIVLGKKIQETQSQSQQSKNKVLASVDYRLGESSQSYGIRFEGITKMDRPQYRWNKEEILRQPLELHTTGKIIYGLENSEKKEIIAIAKLYKSEEQRQAIRQSPEWERCESEESQGKKLSPICMKVRNQAASLDKFEIKIEAPKTIISNPLVQLVGDMLIAKYLPQTNVEQSSEIQTRDENQVTLKLQGRVNHTSEVAQLKVESSASEYTYKVKNIRLCSYLRNIVPLNIRNPISSILLKKASQNMIPSSCAVEPEYVRSFDNKTYKYNLNDCTHLLLADRSRQLPIAVLTTKVSEGKEVTVLSGHYTIRVNPRSTSRKVTINKEHIEVAQGQVYIKKNSEGKVVVEIKWFQDNVILVRTPQQGLVVLTDGHMTEIVAPGLLRGRSLGLCGDYNGEITTDLKTPRKCIMKSSLSAISYMLNKSGSSSASFGKQCSGIPSEKRAEFERESRECTKERIIPTPLMPVYERIHALNKPSVSVHVVDKQQNQVCISKQMVKVCSGQSVSSTSVSSKPELLKPKNLQFVCVSRPSSMSQSLSKRAQSGENLSLELSQLPVVYSKVEFEPMTCRHPSQSESIRGYRQGYQYEQNQY